MRQNFFTSSRSSTSLISQLSSRFPHFEISRSLRRDETNRYRNVGIVDSYLLLEEDVYEEGMTLLIRERQATRLARGPKKYGSLGISRTKERTGREREVGGRRTETLDIRMRKVEILKPAKLHRPTRVSSAFIQPALPASAPSVPVYLFALLYLTFSSSSTGSPRALPTLFAPFISHLAGYCDKRITRFSLAARENVSLTACTSVKENSRY